MIYTHAAVAVLAGALAFAGAWKTQDWRYGAREAERLEAASEQKRMNERAADTGAAAHEADRAQLRTRFVTVMKEAEHVILEKPVYRNVCLDDDGLRILRGAIDGQQQPAGESAPAVPGPVQAR